MKKGFALAIMVIIIGLFLFSCQKPAEKEAAPAAAGPSPDKIL